MSSKSSNPNDDKRLRLVVTGSLREFEECCREQGWIPNHHAIYVHSIMDLVGRNPKDVIIVRYGQAHLNPASFGGYLSSMEIQGTESIWV